MGGSGLGRSLTYGAAPRQVSRPRSGEVGGEGQHWVPLQSPEPWEVWPVRLGLPRPRAFHTPPPSQSLWSSVCEWVPGQTRPSQAQGHSKVSTGLNPEPPGWFDGQYGPGGKCCSHVSDEKAEARRADWLPGAKAARNRTLVRRGASCSPHPLRRSGRPQRHLAGEERGSMSLCRHESGGRQRRSRRALPSQAEVPGLLRLMKTPVGGFPADVRVHLPSLLIPPAQSEVASRALSPSLRGW